MIYKIWIKTLKNQLKIKLNLIKKKIIISKSYGLLSIINIIKLSNIKLKNIFNNNNIELFYIIIKIYYYITYFIFLENKILIIILTHIL